MYLNNIMHHNSQMLSCFEGNELSKFLTESIVCTACVIYRKHVSPFQYSNFPAGLRLLDEIVKMMKEQKCQ